MTARFVAQWHQRDGAWIVWDRLLAIRHAACPSKAQAEERARTLNEKRQPRPPAKGKENDR
jgi:hypothetical protein